MVGSHRTPNMHQNLSETPLNVPLNDQQHSNLNKVIEIKDFFAAEIKKKRINELSKYIASFDYFDYFKF